MPKCIRQPLSIILNAVTLFQMNFMSDVNELKKQVKKYIDEADERTVKIIYAMLEAKSGRLVRFIR